MIKKLRLCGRDRILFGKDFGNGSMVYKQMPDLFSYQLSIPQKPGRVAITLSPMKMASCKPFCNVTLIVKQTFTGNKNIRSYEIELRFVRSGKFNTCPLIG